MKKFLKWAGLVLGGLLALALIAALSLYMIGRSKVNQTYTVNAPAVTVDTDSASIAHGAHLAKIHACTDCHGAGLEGKVFVDAPPFVAVASNLTSGKGGVGARYTDEDWNRSIRYGVKPDGHSVMIMPSKTFHNLSDEDTSDLIAYLKSIPPADHELPTTELRPLGTLLAGAGVFDLADEVHTQPERTAMPPVGVTAAYGDYLSSMTCKYCHGADLLGGPPLDPSMPPSPNLTAAGAWPLDAFKTAMRTGVRPGAPPLNPDHMPWTAFKHMTDAELEAIHLHLKSLAP